MQENWDEMSSEWLSIFVEDCLSCSSSYTITSTSINPLQPPKTATTVIPGSQTPLATTISTAESPTPPRVLKPQFKSKHRKRKQSSKSYNLRNYFHTVAATIHVEPPLLHYQTYWLAESELIFPIKEKEHQEQETEQNSMAVIVEIEKIEEEEEEAEEEEGGGVEGEEEKEMGIRRCSHCLSHKTPQWRQGPLGPKTLCNACGVRFKSGRLLPEYRPAKSPTFVSYKHSNSHKKVMEMRSVALLSSDSSN